MRVEGEGEREGEGAELDRDGEEEDGAVGEREWAEQERGEERACQPAEGEARPAVGDQVAHLAARLELRVLDGEGVAHPAERRTCDE